MPNSFNASITRGVQRSHVFCESSGSGCPGQQSRRRPPTPDGFAFVPIVPCSWTASVGLSNRPVKQRAAVFTSSAFSDAQVRPRKNSEIIHAKEV
jgi:hypothetical protein